MRIAHNPQTGEYLGLRDGKWEKLRIAENSAGDRLYLGENGWEPLNTGGAMTPDKPRGDEKSWGERAAHSLGVGTRDVLEGVGEIAGMFVTPFANAASWALGGRGDEFRNPGSAAADWMGLPKAESDSEKLASAAIRGGAGAIGSVGLGAAPAVAKAAPQVGKILSSGPLSQISGSMAASAGAEAAEQAGGGTAAQTVAGLAGGMVPPPLSVDPETGEEPDGSRERPYAFLYGMDVTKDSYYSYKGKLWLAKADMPACVWVPGTEGLWQWEEAETI
ncbi:hypothetical protein [Desulfovibrio sp.]|uniref:hypothetical protein n=1 Tax=Desulfovibrio sp. TaxID=885 RepID=UPI002A7621BE|nr:hypothetical protein [Desulfovibrio sp.]MDY2666964.1 hypothetical protein [Desulfovibrio sp.]